MPIHTYMQTGLTDSPRADTASPAANTLRAALKREVHDTLAEMQRACDEKIKAQVTE